MTVVPSIRRILAAAAVALCAITASVVTAGEAAAAACSDVDVSFARGTGEFPGAGIVGSPFVSAIKSGLPGRTVSTYAVNYAADVAQTSAGPGATDMSRHVNSAAAACPGTVFVIGGYSQGATVTDIATGTPGVIGRGETISAAAQPRVIAVALFGNPLGLSRTTYAAANPTYGPRSIEFCNPGDPVCGGTGTGPGAGHLSYGSDGSARQAAAFAVQRFTATRT